MSTSTAPANVKSTFTVSRRATRVLLQPDGQRQSDTRSLAEWRALHAYVLLGDPGSGKSTAFQEEAQALETTPIKAQDIVDGIVDAVAPDTTVFIDGLDQVRASQRDGATALGAIRSWLHQQVRPRFRLSCREADWYGEEDLLGLQKVARDGEVFALHLNPLSQEDIRAIVASRHEEVGDPDEFLQRTQSLGLAPLFGNPLLLDLTIVGWKGLDKQGTHTRRDIYASACEQMVREFDQEHARKRRLPQGGREGVLQQAGLLCAVLLLGQREHVSLRGSCTVNAVEVEDIPTAFGLSDEQVEYALGSKLFTTLGGCFSPRHRTLAEFLAARALAELIAKGLPLGRVLALILGVDGRPVEPLRGLLAWLTVHVPSGRPVLMPLDPLGIVVNGDVQSLPTTDRQRLLSSLCDAARQNPWLRRDINVEQPLAMMLSPDMADTVCAYLDRPERDAEHQVFMGMLLDGLAHEQAQRMQVLAHRLDQWVMDGKVWIGNRMSAYRAWKLHAEAQTQWPRQREWLEQLAGLEDLGEADRLLGAILTDAYPQHVGPTQVFSYLKPLRRNIISDYSYFWTRRLLDQTENDDVALLADEWAHKKPDQTLSVFGYESQDFTSKLLTRVLSQCGEKVSTERLHRWLSMGLDEHGLSRFQDDQKSDVAIWLETHPNRMKAVLKFAWERIPQNDDGTRSWWRAEQCLHGAKRPRDWLTWLLEEAATTQDLQLAKQLFSEVLSWMVAAPPDQDLPTLEAVEDWVEVNKQRLPEAPQWLVDAWSSDLEENWQREQHQRKRSHLANASGDRDERQKSYQPFLEGIAKGEAPLNVLVNIAIAHERGFIGIRGETPVERVQNLLLSDVDTAAAAIEAVDSVLQRDDLPDVDAILALDAKGKHYTVRTAAFLAARRASERDTSAPLRWPRPLAETLIAFHLTDGTGHAPAWYELLARERPHWVAPILLRYAVPRLKTKSAASINGLWPLNHGQSQPELVRLVLPELLRRFPTRASTDGRRLLNRTLLPALRHLEPAVAREIVGEHLIKPGIDPMQRIGWLVAALPHDPTALDELSKWVGSNERRAVEVGEALHVQETVLNLGEQLPVYALKQLLQVLGPITPRDPWDSQRVVRAPRNREDTVRGLLQCLAAIPSLQAQQALGFLLEHAGMGVWREEIEYHRIAQAAALREATYQLPSPQAVALALANAAPANNPDLLALITQHLKDLQAQLRGSETFRLRDFWNQETPTPKPLIENDCRDRLINLLQPLLRPMDIDLVTERRHAQDKRADIEVSLLKDGERLYLPIEVKKEDHDKLWTAWRTQLDGLYTIHPDAQGYGLYLVLWFGVDPKAPPNLEFPIPRSAQELGQRLLDRIPKADRHRLAVLVMDLSWPGSTGVRSKPKNQTKKPA